MVNPQILKNSNINTQPLSNYSTQLYNTNSNSQSLKTELMNFPSNDILSDHGKLYQEYQNLFQAHQQLLLKCGKIEESLRNETINSEEQRSYIAILKQALEEKLITNELWSTGSSNNQNFSPVDYYLECKKLKQIVEEKDNDLNEILQNFEESKIQLENSLKVQTELKKEQGNLVEEKETLLEYLDELKNNFMRIEQQNQQYESLISAITQEKEEIKAYYEDLKPQYEEKVEENARLLEEMQSEKALSQEIEIHRQKLLHKNEELEKELLESKAADFKSQNQKLINEVANLTNEKNHLSEKFRITNDNFLTVKSTLQETQADLDKTLEKLDLLQNIQIKYEDLEFKYTSLKDEFEDLSRNRKDEINRFEVERQKKMEEIKGIYQQLSQNRSELRVVKEDLSKNESEKISLIQEIDGLQQQNNYQRSRISSYEAEIIEYKKILEDRDLSSAKLHTLTIKNQAEKEFYEDSMKEIKRKNNELMYENESLTKDLKQTLEKLNYLEDNFENISLKNSKNSAITIEQAFKYVNSMIIDLKRYLGNTKLTRINEKFDLESNLLELHELVIMCLEKLEENNSSTSIKKQILEEKDEEIRSLQEKLENVERNFQKNLDMIEKERAELALKMEYEQKEIIQESKRQDEVKLKQFENEIKFENEQIKESLNKMRKEKNCYEYLIKKIKSLLLDEEFKRVFEEMIAINFEILEQEFKKTDFQVKLDHLTKQKNKDSFYDLNNIKENLYENQKCLEKFYEKKQSLENDLQKFEVIVKRRNNNDSLARKMSKTNSESNLRAIYEETRVTENSLVNLNFESKLSSIKDEKIANKPHIYRDFSSSKYVTYQEKFDKNNNDRSNFTNEINPIYNNLNELRNKFAKKPWKFENLQ